MWYDQLMPLWLELAFVAVMSLACAWLIVDRLRLKLDNDRMQNDLRWYRMRHLARVKEQLPEELKKTRVWRPL